MPVIYSYPTVNPTLQDVLLGTDRENDNQTVGFTIQSLVALVDASSGTGTVTSVNGAGSQFVNVTGGPITTAGTLSVSLSADGTPSSTTFLRGDNTWAAIESIVPSGVAFYDNGSLLSENITSINVTGDGVTVTNQGSGITLDITGGGGGTTPVAGITAITPGTGISAITTSGVTNISNTGVTRIIAGTNISISPSSGTGNVTITSTASGGGADGDTQYAAGSGIRLIPPFNSSTNSPLPEFAVEPDGSNNYISVFSNFDTPDGSDYIPFNQNSTNSVKTVAFEDITIDTLTSVKNYLTQTYITGTDSDGFVKNTTDSFDSIDKVINVVTLTDTEYTALATKDPNTLYLTVTTAPTQYTVTMTPLVNNIVDASGVGYSLTGDLQGATRTGSEGAAYAFQTNAVLAAGYQFTVPFSATNPSGTIPNGGTTVQQTLTGTVELIPNVVTATLNVVDNVNGGEGVGNTFVITGDDTGATDSGDAPHSYSFNTNVTIIDPDYEFVGGAPTITPTQPNTGSISADTTVNTVISGTLIKKTGSATLVITDNITGGAEGVAYQISTNPGNATITGQVGETAEWDTTVTVLGGFEFASGPSFNPGNPVSTVLTTTPQNVPLTITGTIQPISACSNTSVTASAGATIQVTFCDGEIVVLTEGVDNLDNLCIQTGSVVALTGTVTETEFNGACSTPPRYQFTFYNTASATDFTACDSGTLDLSQTTTMFLDSTNYTTATEAFNTETTAGSPADGSYTDCFSNILNITNGQVSHSARTANLAQQSLGSFQATSSDACNNSNSQSTAFVSNFPTGVGVNKILYSTSTPFQGNSISTKTDASGNNFVRFAINPNESYEVGTAGSFDEGRLTSASTCQTQLFTYNMIPCVLGTPSNTFIASSEIALSQGSVYEIETGLNAGSYATLSAATSGTAVATIGAVQPNGCPPPTLAAIILTGNGNDNGCTIPDSEPTFTPCKTWELTGNTLDFVVDFTDCEGENSIEEVPVGTTITRCASDTPTPVGSGGGTISVSLSTCPSIYGYPTRVAWVDSTYENLSNDGQFYGDTKLRIDNYNTGAFTNGLSGVFFNCDPNAISVQSVVADCTTIPQYQFNSDYAVHQSSLVDPNPGHTKIAFSSTLTSIFTSECSAVNITLDVQNSISGGSIGTAYDVTVLAENTTTGNQITYTNLSSVPLISGLPGSGYSFTTTVTAKTGYTFTSGPSFSSGTVVLNKTTQTGSFGSTSSTINLTISGAVEELTLLYSFPVSTQGGGDPSLSDPICSNVGDGPWGSFEYACRCGVQTTPLEIVYYNPAGLPGGNKQIGTKLWADQAYTTPFTGLGTTFDSYPGNTGLASRIGYVKFYNYSTIATSCNGAPGCTTATYKFKYNYNDETLIDVEYDGFEAGSSVGNSGCCVNRYVGGLGCTNY